MFCSAEVFDLFNRADFGFLSLEIFNRAPGSGERREDMQPLGNAGRITETAASSRQIQFALKFIF